LQEENFVQMKEPTPYRRHDLDWLRTLAFALLILYHAGMAYVPEWGWHLKNAQTDVGFRHWMLFLNRWRMPLIFMISGAGVWFSLRRRSARQFAGERSSRLLIPLIFGIFVIVPPQIYLERVVQGINYASYWVFQMTVFEFVPYPEGNFSWHHLWFLPYIWVYGMIGLPLFLWWRSDRTTKFREKVVALVEAKPGWLFAFVILPLTSEALLRDAFPSTHALVNDWANFITYLLYFLAGFFIATSEGFSRAIATKRFTWLTLAITMTAFLYIKFWIPYEVKDGIEDIIYGITNQMNIWAWLLVILGFGYQHLNQKSRTIQYANRAVYPFYILHQTVTIALVYVMLEWSASPWLKFFIAATGTFAVCAVLYEFIIRRTPLLYPVLGLKRRKKPQLSAQQS